MIIITIGWWSMRPNTRMLGMIIAASGTIIEWFDFSLFFYLSTSLAKTFYPNTQYSLPIVLATGAVGFLFRPLGAVVFGHLGDTCGRAYALTLSAAFMAVAMAGVALWPGESVVGVWGGVGILAWRALAGFAVGAEYTGIMVYLMETSSSRRRIFAGSWAAANSEVGSLLAVGSAVVVSMLVGNEALHEWGWRIPFIFGTILASAMIPLRRFMVESEGLSSSVENSHLADMKDGKTLVSGGSSSSKRSFAEPLRHAIMHQWRAILTTFLISTVGSATYFLTITYVPSYVEMIHRNGGEAALNLGLIATVIAILVTPFIGLAADKIGRKMATILTFAVVIVTAFPGYMLLRGVGVGLQIVAVAMLAAPAAAWSAIGASSCPEQFTHHGRFSGMAIGYNVAVILFGGVTPAITAWLTTVTGDLLTPAYYAVAITIIAGIPAIIMMKKVPPQGLEP